MGLRKLFLLVLALIVCCISGYISINLSNQWEAERRQSSFSEVAEIYGDNLFGEIGSLQTSFQSIASRLDRRHITSEKQLASLISLDNSDFNSVKFFELIYDNNKLPSNAVSTNDTTQAVNAVELLPNELSSQNSAYPYIYLEAKDINGDLTNEFNSKGQNPISEQLDQEYVNFLMQNEEVFISNFMAPVENSDLTGAWFYLAVPVNVYVDKYELTTVKALLVVGVDVVTFLENALQKLGHHNLILYLTGSFDGSQNLDKPIMRFDDGVVTPQSIDVSNIAFNASELRYDEMFDLTFGMWPFTVIPEAGYYERQWQDVITGYIAAFVLIMFGALCVMYTVNWTVNLENLIKERTQELENSKKIAQTANKAKTEFLANMSHELRTPLNAVIGFSDIMKSGMIKDNNIATYQEYATDINDSGVHLLRIINDILDLSKVEANKMTLHNCEVSVGELVDTTVSILRNDIKKKQLSLHIDKHQLDNLIVTVDEKLFKQALLNILSNAVKFTIDKGEIFVTATSTIRKGLQIIVRDTGIGMNQDDIPTVMEPFSQVDGGLNRQYEGTGLGLPLVKSFVELHGGLFELQSQLNVGTSAKIWIPDTRVVI